MGKGYAGIQPCMISWKQCFAALVGFVIIFVVILYVVDANAAATTTQTMKIDGMPRMMDGEPEISLISRGGESVVRVRGYFVGMMVKTALAKPGPWRTTRTASHLRHRSRTRSTRERRNDRRPS